MKVKHPDKRLLAEKEANEVDLDAVVMQEIQNDQLKEFSCKDEVEPDATRI